MQLQSAIRYSNEDYAGAQSILIQRKVSHETTLNDEGCLFYQVRFTALTDSYNRYNFVIPLIYQKANAYDNALQRFNAALQTGGFNPLIAYNAALCHFRKRENAQAMNYIGKIDLS